MKMGILSVPPRVQLLDGIRAWKTSKSKAARYKIKLVTFNDLVGYFLQWENTKTRKTKHRGNALFSLHQDLLHRGALKKITEQSISPP